jgi:hypothetical protein
MGIHVCMGAMMQCSFGTSPSALTVLPQNRVTGMTPMANIMDHQPFVNIPPFGQCSSNSNPAVATASAAAGNVLTPMPCTPVTTAPWVVGAPTVLVGNMPALNESAKLMCSFGGVILITNPGQTKVMVP